MAALPQLSSMGFDNAPPLDTRVPASSVAYDVPQYVPRSRLPFRSVASASMSRTAVVVTVVIVVVVVLAIVGIVCWQMGVFDKLFPAIVHPSNIPGVPSHPDVPNGGFNGVFNQQPTQPTQQHRLAVESVDSQLRSMEQLRAQHELVGTSVDPSTRREKADQKRPGRHDFPFGSTEVLLRKLEGSEHPGNRPVAARRNAASVPVSEHLNYY